MIIISFSPALMSDDQCVTSLPFSELAPKRKLEAATLADCDRAWSDARAFAGTIPAVEILQHFGEYRRGFGGEPLVSVHLSWVTRARKPNGFNRRRWHQYVKAAATITTHAAE